MFAMVNFAGEPLTAGYVERRARWEPLYEVTQIKGDGETHPQLSPNDELAGYGIEGWDNGNLTLDELETPEMRPAECAREALKQGLRLEAELGTNPFKFGMVGSSDAHTSLTGVEEDNFWGKLPPYEPSPERATHVSKELNGVTRYAWQYLAGGRAAVWATENTREAIWDALERREVYATTGSRITLRFFGGWEFDDADARSRYPEKAGYTKGVPMGADISKGPEGKSPKFLVSAAKATWTNRIGDPELSAVWEDPDFDPAERAFYYARVVEIPTPRWTAYDAKCYGLDLPDEVPMTTTERAYSSPIWYAP